MENTGLSKELDCEYGCCGGVTGISHTTDSTENDQQCEGIFAAAQKGAEKREEEEEEEEEAMALCGVI